MPGAAGKFSVLASKGIILQRDKPNKTKTVVGPRLVMQHHLAVQGWCTGARASLLLIENSSACHQLRGFHGMSDVAVYLCPFHHEHFIVCGNLLSQHIDSKYQYFNSGDS